jgi:signal transduction histidine kinase
MAKKFIQDLIESLIENVAIVDETGLISHINRSWASFSEQNGGDKKYTGLGANYFESIDNSIGNGDEYAQKIQVGIQQIISKNITCFELEYPCHSNTEQRWFIASFKEIGNYSPRQFLFSHKDVSDLVLRESKVLAAQRLEAVGQLSAGIAHDFNNLLGVIIGNIELAQVTRSHNTKKAMYLDNAIKAVNRGGLQVQKLLSFARKQHLKIEKIEVNEFVINTFEIVRPMLGEDIKVLSKLSDIPLHVNVDAGMLSNAILNCLINSMHAMPSGGTLTIDISMKELEGQAFLSSDDNVFGSYVVIEISDTGIGIQNEDLAKVFEPFYTTKAPEKGSGLGLSMVFGFINQSNGYIDIVSKKDAGTTISFYLPLIENMSKSNQINSDLIPNILESKTILLVEDNPELLETISFSLKAYGCNVIECTTGEEAVEKLRENYQNIDIALADIILPSSINGFFLVNLIRAEYPEIKSLMMSGHPLHKFTESEINDSPLILSKPFSINNLISEICKL